MEPIRSWTTTDGETLEARWDRSDESNPNVIRLISSGEVYTIELRDLSVQDQQYVRNARQQKKASKFHKESESEARAREAGERLVRTLDDLELAFRWCPAGSFMMGSPKEEKGHRNDETQHPVTLSKGFWMLETPVTQEMWRRVMERDFVERQDRRSSFYKGVNYPMGCVSWDECQEFCRRLSNRIGMNVTLPTEAQWEYACRAGTETPFAGDFRAMGWFYPKAMGVVLFLLSVGSLGCFAGCGSDALPVGIVCLVFLVYFLTRKYVHPVGQKKPNAWGLYDMHGNVWEWCQDWYGGYSEDITTDPTGPDSGSYRVVRGGCGMLSAKRCRSASRDRKKGSTKMLCALGFRLVGADPVRSEQEGPQVFEEFVQGDGFVKKVWNWTFKTDSGEWPFD